MAEGLAQIDGWHAWFLTAHAARLAALDLPPQQREAELTAVRALGDAVAARMREDYQADQRRLAVQSERGVR